MTVSISATLAALLALCSKLKQPEHNVRQATELEKAHDPTVVDEKGYATQDQLCHYSSHFFLP